MQHLKRIGHVVFKKFNTFNRYRTATDDDGKIVIAIGHLSDSKTQYRLILILNIGFQPIQKSKGVPSRKVLLTI